MKNNDVILALDQGSSASRALAVAQDGFAVAKAVVAVSPFHKEHICQYDGEELLKSQLDALKQVEETLAAPAQISALAVACQRSTIVFWDKLTGKTLCPVLSWIDGRAAAQIAANPLSQEKIHAKTGLYKTPYFSAPKIQWCLQNYPALGEAYKAGRLLCGPVGTFIIWHLSGGKVFAADPTTAQRTLLFNINTLRWDDDILKSFGISADILPEVRPSASSYGSYKGIPITVCVGDQQAAAASGLSAEGAGALNYGTGAFVLARAGKKPVNLQGILTSLSWTAEGETPEYLLEGPLNTAGALFAWLKDAGLDFDIQNLDGMCTAAENPVNFLPALGGLGAPYWNFSLTPVLSGFTQKTTKADIVCGAVRGLCLLMADITFYMHKAGADFKEMRACGGLSSSRALLQFQSDILQLPVRRMPETESTAVGAAVIASAALGVKAEERPVFKPSAEFAPLITPQRANEEYKKWRNFFDWAVKQPK